MQPAKRRIQQVCRGLLSLSLGILAACSNATGYAPRFTSDAAHPGLGRSAVPDHVMTADVYNSNQESVTPQEAAPYLTWAEANPKDQGSLDGVGIKTLFYLDPSYQFTDGPLYNKIESTFSHTCSGDRITRKGYPKSNPFYLMSRNTALAELAQSFVASLFATYPYDALFEDSAGGLVHNWLSGQPCKFNLDDWIALDAALENTIAQPIVPSALDGYRRTPSGVWENDQHAVHLALGKYAVGGLTEECYSNQSNAFVYLISDTLWEGVENTEIELESKQKQLFCYPNMPVAGDTQPGLTYRMYDYASFLLTYEPSYAVLWEVFSTPSNFHVFPESQLVPLQPVVSQPTDISQLDTGGAYVRKYSACYYQGTLIGSCASIVNPSSSASVPNPVYAEYGHTLVLAGGGVLDGGTAELNGPTAPQTLAPNAAYVVFP